MSEKDVVLYEVADHVATVTLNRPERRNALSVAAFNGLTEIWKDIDKNPKVRVAILTGSDCGTFCAGMDLKEAAEIRAKRGIDIIELIRDPFCRVMREVRKPIVAAMNGHAPAGGMMLTLNSDIRIGLAGSTLGITEVHIGRGSPWAMPAVWMMPIPLLMELTLVGNFMPIERFHQVGFVNYLEPTAAKVMERARTLAARIAEGAPLSVEAAKLSTKAAMDLVVGHAIKEATQIHERAYQSEDAIEGPSAFAEKRKPVWKGR